MFTVLGFSQNKVDELVQKYGENKITLYTTNGELIGEPGVKRNQDNLPFSIKISGDTNDSSKIAEFFLSLFLDKEKEEFIISQSNRMLKYNMNKDYINNLISSEQGLKVEYTKGKYLFSATASSFIEFFNTKTGKYLEVGDSYGADEFFDIRKDKFYKFDIEMIDKSRLGGSESTKFKF
jgi:hypothetical protein